MGCTYTAMCKKLMNLEGQNHRAMDAFDLLHIHPQNAPLLTAHVPSHAMDYTQLFKQAGQQG